MNSICANCQNKETFIHECSSQYCSIVYPTELRDERKTALRQGVSCTINCVLPADKSIRNVVVYVFQPLGSARMNIIINTVSGVFDFVLFVLLLLFFCFVLLNELTAMKQFMRCSQMDMERNQKIFTRKSQTKTLPH